ncbi:MAG: hemolysin family protein [Gammaproteobacteria bacterium]|nr:hemolysin family protein [Gammaproteobacteria bacterium]MDA8024250.1 hemolysin family protein [Gammaproteobacteria bacterium]
MEFLALISQHWDAALSALAFDTARLADADMVARLALMALLLVCSGFFSSSETALFALSRMDLQQLRRDRNPRAESIHELLDQPRRLIISILSGNELVNIAAAANMTSILASLYGGGQIVAWVNLLVMVPLLLLFGEVTPKTVAVSNPVRYSTGIVAAPMRLWVRLISPLHWILRGLSGRITTALVGEGKDADNILHMDEFKTLVKQVSDEGELNATERALIYNLLDAGATEIVEMMTTRPRMAFISVENTAEEMVKQFIELRHSRVPVYKTHRDNLVGFMHAEDVLRLVLDEEDLASMKPEDLLHPPVVVPLTKKVDEMFDFFQRNKVSAAVCLNEFGGVQGFITLRGVLAYIFGDISGGRRETAGFYPQGANKNIYEVPGEMKLKDFNSLANFGMDDPRMTTVGGVAFRLIDRLPQVGDCVRMNDIAMEVLEMDEHRIAKVRVARVSAGKAMQAPARESALESARAAAAPAPAGDTGGGSLYRAFMDSESAPKKAPQNAPKSGKKDAENAGKTAAGDAA